MRCTNCGDAKTCALCECERLRSEVSRLTADLQAINFHLDEYGAGNEAGLAQHKGSVRRAAIFCVQDLWSKLTRERSEVRRLTGEVEAAKRWAKGWKMAARRRAERDRIARSLAARLSAAARSSPEG